MANDLNKLNNILFDTLDKLSDKDLNLEEEIERSKSTISVAKMITENAELILKAATLKSKYNSSEGLTVSKILSLSDK